MRPLVNGLLSLAIAASIAMILRVPMGRISNNLFTFVDLRAFYCSARVARAGFDPYRLGPIGACERALVGMTRSNFVLPSPLPGHAIALFDPLAALAFPVAAVVWCGLLVAVYFVLSMILAKLTGWRYAYALIALLPLARILPIFLGQPAPIAVLLLVLATRTLRDTQEGAAGLLAVAATIEPHIGLPICVALFLNRPRARLSLIVGAVAIAAVTAHTVGLAGFAEYVQRVLPEHIASEARYDDQYSLTYVLTWLRLPVRDAIVIGQESYWVLAATGIAVSDQLTRMSGDVRFLLFVPMAFSVTGGSYVHAEHLLAAVPLAILLIVTAHGRARVLLNIALTLIAWPAKFIMSLLSVPGTVTSVNGGHVPLPVGPFPLLADAAWAARIAPNDGHLLLLVAKVPTWLGLLILLAATALRIRTLTRTSSPMNRDIAGAVSVK